MMEAADGAAGSSALGGSSPVDSVSARGGDTDEIEPGQEATGESLRGSGELPGRDVPGARGRSGAIRTEGPVRESTIVVAGALAGSSRLATRFAPIPDPALVALFPDPGLRHDLEQEAATRVGRDPRFNDLVLVSPSVSSRHCEFIVDDDECTLADLGSSNGTFVNGERIRAPKLLKQGDLITIGRYVFMFVWYRFARPPQPEILSFRDLKQLLVKLYPTTASVHRLLLATGIQGNLEEAGDVSSDQAWNDLIEGFRSRDVVSALEMVLRFAMREHPGNRELERAKFTLDNWRHARKVPGLQDRINADARNSARVVREILITHLESEGDSDSISQMLDEVTEEAPLPRIGTHSHVPKVPTVSRKSGADLPFEVPDDSLVTPPWASNSTERTRDSMEGRSLPDSKIAALSGTNAPDDQEPEPPPLTSLESVLEEEVKADGGATTPGTPLAVVSRLDGSDESETGEKVTSETSSSEGGHDGPRPAVVEVLKDAASAQSLPALKELEDTLAPSPETRGRDEDIEEFIATSRGRSRRRILLGGGVAAVIVVAVGLLKFGPGRSGNEPSHTAETSDAVQVAQVPDAGAPAARADDSGADTGSASDGHRVARAEKSQGSEVHRGSNDVPGVESNKAGNQAETTVALRDPSVATGDVPVAPQFRVINFLDDDGRPIYDSSAFAGSSVWDEQTSQVIGASLSNCVWVDGRRKKLASKHSRLFLYIRCQAGGKPVEGWVYNRAMKRR